MLNDCAGVGGETLAPGLCGVKRFRTDGMEAWSECNETKVTLHNAVHAALGHRHAGELGKDLVSRNHALRPARGRLPMPELLASGVSTGSRGPSSRGLLTLHGLHYVCKHRPRV